MFFHPRPRRHTSLHEYSGKERVSEYDSFVCCLGFFEFQQMPFGLKNAGAAYCRLVQDVVDEVNDPGVSAYIDDVMSSYTQVIQMTT